jgi:hypothetical protein
MKNYSKIILTCFIGFSILSCNNTTKDSSLKTNFFTHQFTIEKQNLNSEKSIKELNEYSNNLYDELGSYLKEKKIANAGILLNFSFNDKGLLQSNPLINKKNKTVLFDKLDYGDIIIASTIHKKCRSQDCVGEFINKMLNKYGGCAVFRIERHTLSADVYADPCE